MKSIVLEIFFIGFLIVATLVSSRYGIVEAASCSTLKYKNQTSYCPTDGIDFALFTINITNLESCSVSPIAQLQYDGDIDSNIYQFLYNTPYTVTYTDKDNCTESLSFQFNSISLTITQPLCTHSTGYVKINGLQNATTIQLNNKQVQLQDGLVQVNKIGWSILTIGQCNKYIQMIPSMSRMPDFKYTPFTYSDSDAVVTVSNGNRYQSINLLYSDTGNILYSLTSSNNYTISNLTEEDYTLELTSGDCGVERIFFTANKSVRQVPVVDFNVTVNINSTINVYSAKVLNSDISDLEYSLPNGNTVSLPVYGVDYLVASFSNNSVSISQKIKGSLPHFEFTPVSYEFTSPTTDICKDKTFNVTINQRPTSPDIPIEFSSNQTITKYGTNTYEIQSDSLVMLKYQTNKNLQIGSLNISGEEPKLIIQKSGANICLFTSSIFIPNFLHFKVLRVFVNIGSIASPNYREFAANQYGMVFPLPRGTNGYVLYQNIDCQKYDFVRRKNFDFGNLPLNQKDFSIKFVVDSQANCSTNGTVHAEFYHPVARYSYNTSKVNYMVGDEVTFRFQGPNIYGCNLDVKWKSPDPNVYRPRFIYSPVLQKPCNDLTISVKVDSELKIKSIFASITSIPLTSNYTFQYKGGQNTQFRIVYDSQHSQKCNYIGYYDLPSFEVDPAFKYTYVTPTNCNSANGIITVTDYQNYTRLTIDSTQAVNGTFKNLDSSTKTITYIRNTSSCVNTAVINFDIPQATPIITKLSDGTCITDNTLLIAGDSLANIQLKLNNNTNLGITSISSNTRTIAFNSNTNLASGFTGTFDNSIIISSGKCIYRAQMDFIPQLDNNIAINVDQATCLSRFATVHIKSKKDHIILDEVIGSGLQVDNVNYISTSYITVSVIPPNGLIPIDLDMAIKWNSKCSVNFKATINPSPIVPEPILEINEGSCKDLSVSYIFKNYKDYIYSVSSNASSGGYVMNPEGVITNANLEGFTIDYLHKPTSCRGTYVQKPQQFDSMPLDTSAVVVVGESCLGSYDGSISIRNSDDPLEHYRLLDQNNNDNGLLQAHINQTHTRFYGLTTGNYTLSLMSSPYCSKRATIEITSTEPVAEWDYSNYICPEAQNGYIRPALNGNFVYVNYTLRIVGTQDYQYSSSEFTNLAANLYEIKGVINDHQCQRNLRSSVLEIKTQDFKTSFQVPQCEFLRVNANFPFKLGIYNIEAERSVFNSSIVNDQIEMPLTSGRYILYFVSNVTCQNQINFQMNRCPGSEQEKKNRNLAIGLGVGIGGTAIIGAAVSYIVYTKRQKSRQLNSSANFKPVEVPMQTIVIENK